MFKHQPQVISGRGYISVDRNSLIIFTSDPSAKLEVLELLHVATLIYQSRAFSFWLDVGIKEKVS